MGNGSEGGGWAALVCAGSVGGGNDLGSGRTGLGHTAGMREPRPHTEHQRCWVSEPTKAGYEYGVNRLGGHGLL